jgi:hypothetical protein
MSETADLAGMVGGSDAPGNEASATGGAGENGGSAGTQAAAWTNQLPKEFRESAEFGRIAVFKTVGELAQAYAKSAAGEADLSDFKAVMRKLGAPGEGEAYGIEDRLGEEMKDFVKYAKEASLTKEQAAKMADGYRDFVKGQVERNLKQTREKAGEIAKSLTSEFGEASAEYYRRAVEHTGLNKKLAETGLGANRDLARALCLLGREMSEDTSVGGRPRADRKPHSVREGAMLSYS